MKSDWNVEKKMLEQHLSGLKEQLREKEEKLNLVTAQKVIVGFFLFHNFFLKNYSILFSFDVEPCEK
jgi:hypothetical protein